MTALDWNYDINAAPQDGSPIWAACVNGAVVKTYYLPPLGRNRPVGRWCFLHSKETPLAWMPYVIPKHPLGSSAL